MLKFELKRLRNNLIAVKTPYNHTFVDAIKMINGSRWNPELRVWVVPAEYLDEVRNIILDIWCEDDRDPY